jgi:aminoglycoside phosphotransferase (APT) family kinase protein
VPGPAFTREGFAALLAAREPARRATVTAFAPISGGYSRLTAVADVTWDDAPVERFVLRADPPPGEGVFVSDRDDEWELLRALAQHRPVPTAVPRWYDATGEHFGTKCLVTEHFPGCSLQDAMLDPHGEASLTDLYLDVLASVHRTPLGVLPATMPRPTDWDAYVDGLLAGYADVERELSDSNPVLRYVSARLRSHRPPPVPFSLVHGDCQPSNVLVTPTGEHVLIDWEFARVGDPREDLGYYTQSPMEPNVYHRDPERFLAGYRARTGLTEEQVNPQVVEWFLVLGIARLHEQILRALEDVGQGRSHGVMATYLVNAVTHLDGLFFRIARGLPA